MLDVPSQSQGEAMGPTSWPLECTVWLCAEQGKGMATKAEVELLKTTFTTCRCKAAWPELICYVLCDRGAVLCKVLYMYFARSPIRRLLQFQMHWQSEFCHQLHMQIAH